MSKRFLIMLLAGLLVQTAVARAALGASKAEKVKTGIVKLGIGADARVEAQLHDKTKLKGYVSQVDEKSFAITDPATGRVTAVSYTDVKRIQGHNLSTGAKIGIGIAIGFLVTALIIWASVTH